MSICDVAAETTIKRPLIRGSKWGTEKSGTQTGMETDCRFLATRSKYTENGL